MVLVVVVVVVVLHTSCSPRYQQEVVILHTLCCPHTTSCSITRPKSNGRRVEKIDFYNGINDMYGQKSVLVWMGKSSAI